MKDTIKNNVIKSLIILSKYLGHYDEFKKSLKNYGITMKNQDNLQSFLRLFKANGNTGLDEWIKKAYDALRPNEQLYLKFAKFSGIREQESINSFNLILKLSKENKLEEYYDKTLNVLMHFRYPKLFIRGTKNVYISFIPQSMIDQIANSETLTYNMIKKRLQRNSMKMRINELRDQFGTYLIHHEILQQEIDLLQGRIPVQIFIRHYWSPKLGELRDRIFKALEQQQ